MARSLGILTGDTVVARARSAIGSRTVYALGQGGRNPRAAHPGSRLLLVGPPRLDCSGFAAWCVGVDRYLPNGAVPHLPGGEWFETTQLCRDGRTPFGYVTAILWAAAEPGDLLAYPDSSGRQGHVGVVSDIAPGWGPARVIHCSAGNFRATGDAIQETGPEVFLPESGRGSMVLRVAWVQSKGVPRVT